MVSKQSGTNTIAVADDVKARLATLAQTLPKDVQTQLISDQSVYIKKSVSAIETHLMKEASSHPSSSSFFLPTSGPR